MESKEENPMKTGSAKKNIVYLETSFQSPVEGRGIFESFMDMVSSEQNDVPNHRYSTMLLFHDFKNKSIDRYLGHCVENPFVKCKNSKLESAPLRFRERLDGNTFLFTFKNEQDKRAVYVLIEPDKQYASSFSNKGIGFIPIDGDFIIQNNGIIGIIKEAFRNSGENPSKFKLMSLIENPDFKKDSDADMHKTLSYALDSFSKKCVDKTSAVS